MNKIKIWLPLIVYSLLIFYFSSIPKLSVPEGIDISYYHFLAYFVLSFLFLRLFSVKNYKHAFILAVISSTVFGLLIEIWQLFLPLRTFSYFDILLNFIGSLSVFVFKSERLKQLLFLE